MFERYCYEDPDVPDRHERQLRILDRRRGLLHPIAWCNDREVAERIVRLLNADAAQLERQGARVA